MEKVRKNYKVGSLGDVQTLGRVTFNEALALTGSEISVNELPAGVSVPFVHAHKQNEEVYIFLSGKGVLYIDGDEFGVEAGNVVRVDPAGARCVKADSESSLRYLCIQTKTQSLVQFTATDGVPVEAKPTWLA